MPRQYTTDEIIHHFGGPLKLAELLDCSRSAVYMWRGIVPRDRAFEVMVLSHGKFNLENMPLGRPVNPTTRQLVAEFLAA